MRCGFIKYKGKRIWLARYNDFGDDEQALEQEVLLATQTILKEPDQSILLLVDYRNTGATKNNLEVLKDSALKVKKLVIKSAVVGVSGIKEILLRAIIRVSGLEIKVFDDLETAKNWLVDD